MLRIRKSLLLLISACLMMSLSGCLAPEKGSAEITLNKDGSYSLAYRGSMAHVMALAMKAQGKPIAKRDQDGIDQQLASLARDKDFLSVRKASFGRIDVNYLAKRPKGQTLKFIGDSNIITIIPNPTTKSLLIRSAAITPKNVQELSSIGYAPDIKLTVYSELPVISHNGAASAGGMFSKAGYSWHISLAQRQAVSLIAKMP